MTLGNLLTLFAYTVFAAVLTLTVLTMVGVNRFTLRLRDQEKQNPDFEARQNENGLYKYRFETAHGPVILWAINGKKALKKFQKLGLTQIDNHDD